MPTNNSTKSVTGSLHIDPTTGATVLNTGSGYVPVTGPSYSSSNWSVGPAHTHTYTASTASTAYVTQNANGKITGSFDEVYIDGKPIGKLLEKINSRLAILDNPDPVKLEKFMALKEAYDHYKMIEMLLEEDERKS